MKIGLNVPGAHLESTPGLLRDFARRAEDLGFAELFLGEHVVLFDEFTDRYEASDDGKPFFPSTLPLPDPLLTHAFLASCTERIRLGTGVMLLPQRNPVYTAKHVASLDWLSDGRLDLGVGVGWSRQEFAACNVPWAERMARAEEYILVMRQLWAEGVSEFSGRYYTLPACRQDPKPVQRPHPPIWIGGWADSALDRAARLGDGWYGFDLSLELLEERLATLRELCSQRGTDFDSLSLSMGGYSIQPRDPHELEAYAALGIGLFAFTLLSTQASDTAAEMKALAQRFGLTS